MPQPLEAPTAFRAIDRSRYPPSGVRFVHGDGRAAVLAGGRFEVWDLATCELAHWVSVECRPFAWAVLPGASERHLVGGTSGPLRIVTGDSKVERELALEPAAASFFSSEACGFWTHRKARTPDERDEFRDYEPYTVPCSAAVDRSGSIAAVAYGQGFVLLWSLVDGRLLACLGYDRPAERAEHVYRTDISPDGATVLTRSDGRIRLWNWRSGRELRSFRVAAEGDHAVNPDGPLPFCAGGIPPAVFLDRAGHMAVAEGETIGVYGPAGERVGRWRGHADLHPIMGEHLGLPRILDIRLSADRRRALSVGVDASLRVWDTHLGEELWSVTPDPCCSDWADLSADGRRVIWTGCPGTRLYDVD